MITFRFTWSAIGPQSQLTPKCFFNSSRYFCSQVLLDMCRSYIYSQQYTITIKKHISLPQKVVFVRDFKHVSYVLPVYVLVCINALLSFIRMLLVCICKLPVCIRVLTVLYPYVTAIYSCVPVCTSVLF